MDELEIVISADLDQNKSVTSINKSIKKIEKKIEKLKLQVTLDNEKSKSAITKEIEKLNKKKRQLYVDLKVRKNDLKKQFLEIQKESNLSLNVNTETAQRQIKNVSNTMGDTKNETIGLGLALKNAFSNAGLIMTAQNALNLVKRAANEATKAVKEYDQYVTNLSIINGESRGSNNRLLGNLAEKSLDFKTDISSLESAAETLLRTGKSIDETNKYLENTIYLSKLGFQDMDTSASQLVTIGNAYGYTADEMAAVVDKFVKLDSTANVTAGKLAEGVAKSAANSKLAGFNIDELAASIAGLKEVTGRTESEISNSLNMIFARLQNVKLGKFILETEDGDTEDITQQINDMEKLLDTFGIKLRNSKNEFRDINELFTELSDNWSKFNNVQKSAIATTAAGARQRNVFIALIENWNKIKELTDVSLNSMGTAVEKYDNYLQSIEAKSATLSTSMKELWNDLLPTDFVGDITDATTSVVQFTDKYQILQTALKSAVFYGLAKGAIAAKNSLVSMADDIRNVSYAMDLASKGSSLTSQQFNALGLSLKGLSDKQQKLILSTKSLTEVDRINLLQLTGLSEAEAKAKLQTLGLSQANQQATNATFSLSGAFKSLWATIVANPVLSLTIAFTAVSTIITTVKQKQEELRQSISEIAQTAKEQTDKLNDLISTYEEFADKVTYTSEEKAKLKSIQEQLVEAYHTEVDGIDLVNGKYDEQIEKLRQLKKEKLEDAELSLIAEREQAKQDSKNGTVKDVRFKISSENFKTEDDYNKIAQALKELKTKSSNYAFSDNISLIDEALGFDGELHFFSGNSKQRVKEIKEVMNVLKEYGYTNLTLYSELNDLLAEHQKLVDAENSSVSNLAENKFQQFELNNPFEKVDGKDTYIAWKNSLLETAKGDTDLQNELSSLAEKQFPDYQKYFDNIAELKAKYVDTRADISNAISKMDFIKSLSIEDSEIATQIPDLFKNGLDGASKAITEWKNNPDNQISVDVETSEIDTSSLEELQEAYDNLSKSAESYTKAQKTLTDSLKEQEEYGQLSASTIQSLTDAGYAQALSINTETGAVTLNTEAYERLNNEKKQKLKLDLDQQNTNIQDKIKEEESTISSLKREYEALAKANAEANSERLKEIEIELAAHSQDEARLRDLVDKNNAAKIGLDAPTFEKSDNKDLWKEEAEEKIAEIKHLYEMEQITYASYLSQLDKLNEKYFANDKKYLDDFRKYQEEVYKGRKKLNEDLIAEQEKNQKAYHDSRISELEMQITVTTNDSVDNQGNKLNVSERFDYLRAVYDEILAEIERRENEITRSGIEGHEDELAELAKKYEEYANKKADIFKDEIQYEIDYISELEKKYNDFIDKRVDRYEDEKDALEDRYDTEIDAIDKTIKALKDKNQEDKTALDLAKAKQELENAKQRTRKVYGAGGLIVYNQDTNKISEAQQKVNDLEQEQIINGFEKLKDTLEDQKKIEVGKYDSMINALNEQKDKQSDYYDSLLEILNAYLNPKATENLDTVFERILGDKDKVQTNEGSTTVNGNTIDTSKVDSGEVKYDKVNNQLKNATEIDFKEILKDIGVDESIAKSLTPEKLSQIFGLSSVKPNATIINQPDVSKWTTQTQTQRNNNNNSQLVNVTFEGGINIQNPVGEVQQFAKELLLQLPTAFNRQIYSNLK